jgi:hypothetical protein
MLLAGVASAGDLRAMLSPGALTRAHDAFAGDCDQCHLVFSGIPDGKCLGCHEAIADRLADARGYHAAHAAEACATCHPDHRGLDFRGTTDEAVAAFDHAATGFSIGGGHKGLACTRCHDGPLEKMPESCGGCHEDPHDGGFGGACQECHTDAGWKPPTKSLASHATAMDGGHAGLSCQDCHDQGQHLDPTVPCATCHAQAHGGTRADCADCHQVSGWKPAEFDHGPCTCAFPGKHQTVGCLECHANFTFTDTPTLCGGCHERDRKHEPLGECARCHDATSWSDSQFDHDRSKFPLRGRHLAVSCTQCHPTAGQFRDAPTACAGCHADQGMQAHGDFGPCEKCHAPVGFSPSSFDHASVGFPLTGKHADTPCQSCHAEKVQGYVPPG